MYRKSLFCRKISVFVTAFCLFAACSKEEEGVSGIDKYAESITGKWQVTWQGQFNSTDTTVHDTIVGTPADFMEFRKTDTVYSRTVLPIPATAVYSILNVRRFLINGDTVYNRSVTEGVLQLYTREPLTDTSYTEKWVDLRKEN